MTCAQTRLALSAVLDGEDPHVPRDELAAHLDTCVGCRDWRASAEAVTSATRSDFRDVPDLVERILTAAPGRQPAGLNEGPRRVLRLALAVSAVAQLLLAVPLLFADAGDVSVHDSREAASFDVAVAVGFLFAAWRPARANALVPVAVALSLCLFVTGLLDVASNTAALAHELGHLVVVVQAVALWALGRAGPRAPGESGGSLRVAA